MKTVIPFISFTIVLMCSPLFSQVLRAEDLSAAEYDKFSAKELADHINAKLIGGQGVAPEAIWKNIYRAIRSDKFSEASSLLDGLIVGAIPLKDADGDCAKALKVLHDKLGGK